jgi:hypothetical protein
MVEYEMSPKAHMLNKWFPDAGSILGGGHTLRGGALLEEVGHKEYAFVKVKPCLQFFPLFVFPVDHEVNSPCHVVWPHYKPRINEDKDYGLNALKTRAKINNSIFQLLSLVFWSQYQKGNKKL